MYSVLRASEPPQWLGTELRTCGSALNLEVMSPQTSNPPASTLQDTGVLRL